MFVGGLSWDTIYDGLRNYFSEFGKVDACTIVRDAKGRSRGFVFLTFEDPASVNAVMIREHFLDGKAIDLERAIPPEKHPRNTQYLVGGLAPHRIRPRMLSFPNMEGWSPHGNDSKYEIVGEDCRLACQGKTRWVIPPGHMSTERVTISLADRT
ncbi:hypothetical protein EDB84DRAFT_1527123 [Lactarius hengduanensis]|nr:hypothetical protein EDB84DRAFT_1527123 [Lactarius hengduanensis]